MCTIDQVADFFILRGRESGAEMTPLRIQKLCYYAQAWHLALKNKPLVSARFQAWIHGPANPELYRRFKRFKWRAIGGEIDEPVLSKANAEFLTLIWREFGPYDGFQLELMTHQEEPWLEARRGLAADENGCMPIQEATMKRFYKALNEQASAS